MTLVAAIQATLMLATLTSRAALAAPPTKQDCAAANEAAQHAQQAHQLLRARADLLACAAEACPVPIRQDCARRLDEVEAATPSVVVEVRDAAGADVPRAEISVDGRPFVANAGTSVELDPGDHSFLVQAPGMTPASREIVAAEGVKARREVVTLRRSPVAAGRSPARLRPPPIASWIAFSVAGAGMSLGVGAGLIAVQKHATLQGECGSTCAPQYSGDLDAFHAWRAISTAGYVVGALGLAGGVVVWILSPARPTTVGIQVGPDSVGVSGSF